VPTSTDEFLSVQGLTVSYSGQPALRGVNVRVNAGDCVCVVGANGAGKSTLAGAVAGLVRIDSGRVGLEGNPLKGLRADQIVRRGIAFVPEGRGLFTHLTVMDNIRMGGYVRRDLTDELALERVRRFFPELLDRLSVRAGQLSGGQQQMLAIARALMSQPRLLILDEPTMGLAPTIIARLAVLLTRLQVEDGLAVMILDQRRTLAQRLGARGYILRGGEVVAEVAASQWDDPDLAHLYLLGTD
jgi:branched-chain amino acid transport system ATP-binding protein